MHKLLNSEILLILIFLSYYASKLVLNKFSLYISFVENRKQTEAFE